MVDFAIMRNLTVHKKGKKHDCGNYMPLSMLSIPSKITESATCDELDKQMETVLQDSQWDTEKESPQKQCSCI